LSNAKHVGLGLCGQKSRGDGTAPKPVKGKRKGPDLCSSSFALIFVQVHSYFPPCEHVDKGYVRDKIKNQNSPEIIYYRQGRKFKSSSQPSKCQITGKVNRSEIFVGPGNLCTV